MLCVPTVVAPSSIHGMGLFSSTALPAGTVVWEYTEGVDWRLTREELDSISESFRAHLLHYAYQEESGLLVLCGDNARFMNHSDDPNCDDSGPTHTVTRTAILPGEELTCDYRSFDVASRSCGIAFDFAGS